MNITTEHVLKDENWLYFGVFDKEQVGHHTSKEKTPENIAAYKALLEELWEELKNKGKDATRDEIIRRFVCSGWTINGQTVLTMKQLTAVISSPAWKTLFTRDMFFPFEQTFNLLSCTQVGEKDWLSKALTGYANKNGFTFDPAPRNPRTKRKCGHNFLQIGIQGCETLFESIHNAELSAYKMSLRLQNAPKPGCWTIVLPLSVDVNPRGLRTYISVPKSMHLSLERNFRDQEPRWRDVAEYARCELTHGLTNSLFLAMTNGKTREEVMEMFDVCWQQLGTMGLRTEPLPQPAVQLTNLPDTLAVPGTQVRHQAGMRPAESLMADQRQEAPPMAALQRQAGLPVSTVVITTPQVRAVQRRDALRMADDQPRAGLLPLARQPRAESLPSPPMPASQRNAGQQQDAHQTVAAQLQAELLPLPVQRRAGSRTPPQMTAPQPNGGQHRDEMNTPQDQAWLRRPDENSDFASPIRFQRDMGSENYATGGLSPLADMMSYWEVSKLIGVSFNCGT